jgi:hypothetical protein
MIDSSQELRLPRIVGTVLRNISLYSMEPTIRAEFGDGVFCLAGANGLGKSTFLAVLNFALTGVVPEPGRTFQSVEEFYKFNVDFAKSFFTGRISESDRESAEVTIEIRVGSSLYTLTRGMFEPDELRDFKIESVEGGDRVLVRDSADETPGARHDLYAQAIAADVGLSTFEQFVFLQHFVFTFDERRHLLFWDEKVLDQVLYLAFGVDYAEAQRADQLRRESERADSLARNHNWQATELRKKIEDLNDALDAKEPSTAKQDLVVVHKSLTETVDRAAERLQDSQSSLNEALLRLAELGAQYATLRSEYEAEFSRRMTAYSNAGHHPTIAMSIASNRCEICGTGGESIARTISDKIDAHMCPLCDSPLQVDSGSPNIARLQALDKSITKNKSDLAEASRRHSRVSGEINALQLAYDGAATNLKNFEDGNAKALRSITQVKDQLGSIDLAIQRYRTQHEELLAKKKHQYSVRDDKRRALLSLQKKLVKQYQDAEEEFVPSFKRLARSFLGIDLDISLQPKSPVGLSMQLEVKSSARRHTYQLSESQRFFVDIALRMALINHMSSKSTKGKCLRYRKNWVECKFGQSSFVESFEGRIELMTRDIESTGTVRRLATIVEGDSRKTLGKISGPKFKLCVTSPPYLNSFDYTDVYRPELFLGKFIKTPEELRQLRFGTMRSHVQVAWHDPKERSFGPIFDETMRRMDESSIEHWNAKVPKMIRAYFEDVERILLHLRRLAVPDASLWVVVSTSAYAGVEIPVDLIYAEVGQRTGWNLREVGVLRHLRSSGQHANTFQGQGKAAPRLRESVVILDAMAKKTRAH